MKTTSQTNCNVLYNIREKFNQHRLQLILLFFLIFGFTIRVLGITYGLPQHFHPDEPILITKAFQFLKSGDINPHFFNYPSFLMYLNAAIYFLYQNFQGFITSDEAYIIGRLIVATLGTFTIAFTYLIGKNLFNIQIGIIGAAIITILPLHVNDSHYATVDIPLTFFVTLSFFCIYYIVQKGLLKWYLASGICIGLATATKYNGGLLCFVLLVAFILRLKFQYHINFGNFRSKPIISEVYKLIFALMATIGTFFITSPFVFLDYDNSIKNILFEMNHMKSGHGDLFLNTSIGYIYHLKTSFYTGVTPIILFLFFLGIVLLITNILRYPANTHKIIASILILSWIIPYYCIIGSWEVKFVRYIIPLLPFLSICAAYSVCWIIGKFSSRILPAESSHKKILISILLTIVVLVVLISPMISSINVLKNFMTDDTRTISLDWIDSNIPSNSSVIIQSYTPEISLLKKFNITINNSKIPYDKSNDNADYLITSSYTYGRFFYFQPEFGSDPIEKEPLGSEKKFFEYINDTYFLIYELHPSQNRNRMGMLPISNINGPLTGPVIKIFKKL
jgi:4-amino-4-deoxy-L-arabinose transferase-like glycosyltransferase